METLQNKLEVNSKVSELPILMVLDRVLIERLPDSQFLDAENTIVKPVGHKEEFATGIIKSIGPGSPSNPYGKFTNAAGEQVEPHLGLTVNYHYNHAIKFPIEGKEYDMIRGGDIIAVP